MRQSAQYLLSMHQATRPYTIWGTETIRTYEYDDERNLIRETSATYNELNPTSCDYECYDKKYEYDSKGILIRTVSKNMDGDIVSVTNYEYDSKGILIRTVSKNMDGDIVSVTNYEYDSKGQLIRESTEYADDGRGSVSDYVYDHLGNLTLEFRYSVDEYYTYYSGDYTIPTSESSLLPWHSIQDQQELQLGFRYLVQLLYEALTGYVHKYIE